MILLIIVAGVVGYATGAWMWFWYGRYLGFHEGQGNAAAGAAGSASTPGSAPSLAVERQEFPEAAAAGASETGVVNLARSAPVERFAAAAQELVDYFDRLQSMTRKPMSIYLAKEASGREIYGLIIRIRNLSIELKAANSAPAVAQKATSSFDGIAGERATEPNVPSSAACDRAGQSKL